MSVYRCKNIWWYEFVYAGNRIRESVKTTRKSIAVEAEKHKKLDLERVYAGLPVEPPACASRVFWTARKPIRRRTSGHRAKSITWVSERIPHVERLLGNILLPDLTEDRIREYMKTRTAEGVGGRTINMEVSVLARAIGKTWNMLWPKLRHNEEPRDTGRALSAEEQERLLAAVEEARSPVLKTFVKGLLLSAMRSGEFTGMHWQQVDFENRVMTVGKAKTPAGTGRQIPMNEELFEVMKEHAS